VPAGYAADATDCNDANAGTWGASGATSSVQWTTPVDLEWSAPADLGGTGLVTYDLLRSIAATDFDAAAVCLETSESNAAATDPETPGAS
jgi:hypothetical protein